MDGKCKHCQQVVAAIDDGCAGYQCPNCGKYTSADDLLDGTIQSQYPCVIKPSADVLIEGVNNLPAEFTHGQHEYVDGKCRRCGLVALESLHSCNDACAAQNHKYTLRDFAGG